MTFIGDQDVLLGSIMQLLLTQRAVTTGCKVLMRNKAADVITLSSPGWMIKVKLQVYC